ncbi:type II TA system antitoxin MqsA family protein [Komagataeibacter oboediens]|uniref:type II TA system antitoxin MqsA family protein n=1 Tax=Komagataeibacter oboediens TaxID=65958 RepID=UPI001C2D2EB0|nr:type II TA system antitoxin MqsA family protein [Komagataeibacter oboediens]MBV1824759.1 type II toxin-antitoxin system MqsA family antitoxin [Komagataeibacter oboediens]
MSDLLLVERKKMTKNEEMEGFERFDNVTMRVGSVEDDNYIDVENLSGWKSTISDEYIFDDSTDSAIRYAQASDTLVLRQREKDAQFLKQARKSLNITQQEASKITGGGHNAFSRYENGTAKPMPAVINLFKLLSLNPDLLGELMIRN